MECCLLRAIFICNLQENYYEFDGFVVLHGTDTMAYTASALSFMFENLGKPVILTGSQVQRYVPVCISRSCKEIFQFFWFCYHAF